MHPTAALLLAMTSQALGHAVMLTPEPRKTGPAHVAACGEAVTDQLEYDIAGPVENAMEYADEDYNCNVFLCRGYQFEDNSGNVHAVSAGDVLDFHIDLIAGHRPGYANMSVVDTETNTVVGSPLRVWDEWPIRGPHPRGDVDFNVTIPEGIDSTCGEAGRCVLQWYWYAVGNKQTYESCLDISVTS